MLIALLFLISWFVLLKKYIDIILSFQRFLSIEDAFSNEVAEWSKSWSGRWWEKCSEEGVQSVEGQGSRT